MNISQSTYSNNNSRFVSTHKDPLEKFKQGQKERFKQTYDLIEEQQFIQPYIPPDGTILLTEHQSLRSFLNSTQKINEIAPFEEELVSYQKPQEIISVQGEQQSMTTRKTKHRIFEPLPLQIPLFKSLITTSQTGVFTKQLLQEKTCQTSFLVEKVNKSNQIVESVQIPRPRSSIGIQVDNIVEPVLRETVSVQYSIKQSCNTSLNVQSYLDRHYDYQQLEPHSNWKPCVSELKLNSHFEDFNYSFCKHCNQFIKTYDFQDSFHQNKCQELQLENTFQEMIGKFQYLLSLETNQLRDFDEACIKMRKCCFATQEICILLINTNCEKRQAQLKQDIKRINREVQKLKDNHSLKIHQLFQKLIDQL